VPGKVAARGDGWEVRRCKDKGEGEAPRVLRAAGPARRRAAAEEAAAPFCGKIGGSNGSAIPRSKGGEQRLPVEIDYEKSLCPKPSDDPPLPQGRQHPRRGPASIRSRRTSRAERPVGPDPARRPRSITIIGAVRMPSDPGPHSRRTA